MAKRWIQKAIKRPGALRAKAKKAGLVKGEEKLSQTDLNKLAKKGGTRTKRQVAMARTLKKLGRKRKKK